MNLGHVSRFRRWGVALLGAALLAACDIVAPIQPTLKPKERPAAPAPPPVVAQPTSQKSARLRSYLNQVQVAQLSNGLLRRDSGAVDAPYNADQLAHNFEQIAFFNEYDGGFSRKGGTRPLQRWNGPVRMQVIFGAGIPPSQRAADKSAVVQYASRLGKITGHPISHAGRPNFFVVFAGEDDRDVALDEVVKRLPKISRDSLRVFQTMDRNQYCGVVVFPHASNPNVYNAAVAVIRSENPDLLRLSCIHEELAQGLGLANDSPDARPSIFNDNNEFALLTGHDELLLQLLYDPRLRPGMSAAEAAPITRIIAREMTRGPQ